jgi:thiol:disulfide interchange protein DsbD
MMKKLPKSGSWLNVVKVIFAFILIAFALKYLSAADQYLGYGLISRTLFISIWIGIGILLTLYLIGLFKTKHDHGAEEGVGYFRILLAIFSLSFTIYISTGLAKNDLNGLSSLLPPKEITVAELPQNSPLEGTTISGLCGVAKYADAKHVPPYGLQAYYTISEALECAKQQNKPVLLSFKSLTCSACKLMEANVWSKAEILAILKNEVVLANLYVDNETELPENEWITSTIDGKVKKTLGRVLRDYQLSRFGVASQPYYVLIDHSEKTLVKPVGECSEADFKKFLTDGIKKFKGE